MSSDDSINCHHSCSKMKEKLFARKVKSVPMITMITLIVISMIAINIVVPLNGVHGAAAVSSARRPKGAKIEQKFYDHVNANILSTAMLASAGAFNKHSIHSHTAVNSHMRRKYGKQQKRNLSSQLVHYLLQTGRFINFVHEVQGLFKGRPARKLKGLRLRR